MKKILVIAIAAISLQSCSYKMFAKKVQDFADTHCHLDTITNPFTKKLLVEYRCDSLYNAGIVGQKCKSATICFNAAQGSVTAKLDCQDSTFNFVDIVTDLFFQKSKTKK